MFNNSNYDDASPQHIQHNETLRAATNPGISRSETALSMSEEETDQSELSEIAEAILRAIAKNCPNHARHMHTFIITLYI